MTPSHKTVGVWQCCLAVYAWTDNVILIVVVCSFTGWLGGDLLTFTGAGELNHVNQWLSICC